MEKENLCCEITKHHCKILWSEVNWDMPPNSFQKNIKDYYVDINMEVEAYQLPDIALTNHTISQ